MTTNAYRELAVRLNALPNGFPPTDDGRELRLLAKLFTPEEAELAAQLRPWFESPEDITARTGREIPEVRNLLKAMSRRGLIEAGRGDDGLGFKLMPFVVGIYEMQVSRMDEELAQLFEDYFQSSFREMLRVKPQFHRVIPVYESVRNSMEVRPFESAAEILNSAQSWGVLDCICRKQKALIGEGCAHPIDVCMIIDPRASAFDKSTVVRALSKDEAMATLQRASDAGLVHTVSNNQEGTYYICNCCTCSCGILRGMAELGIANVVASSAFVNQVDTDLCTGCENCIPYCQFNGLTMVDLLPKVDTVRCVGCGVCVLACPTGALGLVRRPVEEVMRIPETPAEWRTQRAASRGL
ncbi:MAG: 4Fe-4S binding protein [Chloroflexota bacterium]